MTAGGKPGAGAFAGPEAGDVEVRATTTTAAQTLFKTRMRAILVVDAHTCMASDHALS